MAIFKCDSCGYERDVPDKLFGKKAKCPDCGHGVTIVDQLPEDELFSVVEFEENPVPVTDGLDPVWLPDGEPLKTINLDEDVVVNFNEAEDIICAQCGHIQAVGTEGKCSRCGAPFDAVAGNLEDEESGIDVSDLAVSEVSQVWDADYRDKDGESPVIDEEKDPDRWRLFQGSFTLNLYAGIVSGVLSLFLVYALSLLASSPAGMHEFLPYILGTALSGVIVGSIIYSLLSRIPFALVGPETVLTTVLFLFIGSLYHSMVDSYSVELILPTILASIALSAFIAGGCLFVLGKFRVGEFVRFIPLQIIGGVIGGVGVFVLLGALDWMGGGHLDWSNIYSLALSVSMNIQSQESLQVLVPSVAFGIVLFLTMQRSKNSLLLLALILAASGAGYALGIWGTGPAFRHLADPEKFSDGSLLMHLVNVLDTDLLLSNIQWAVIKSQGLYIGALVILTVLTVMYRISRLELLRGRESSLDTEYNALGVTNMLSGICCGMPVSLSYGRSVGNYDSGARGPVAGIVAGGICALGLFYADLILPLIPRFVPEGLLIYVGLDLIRDWMFRTKTAFTSWSEVWLLRLTFLVTICLGLLEGIGFGVVLALMVTVSRASRGGVIRNVLSGSNHTSNVDRASAQQRALKEFGDHIHIMRLQGFLFLGSIERLLKDIRMRLEDRNQLSVEYLILDFKLVNGFASATSIGFLKLHQMAIEYNLDMIITSAPLELEEHLEEIGHVGAGESLFRTFLNLDYALEWCENQVLDSENMLELKQMTLPELLAPVFPEPKYIPALMKVLKREVAESGEAVFRQGDRSDSMFFVESGRLDVELELEGGKLLRLKKVGPGAVFGEMGIYRLVSRSATVRAAEKCVLYRMTLEKLDAIEARAPRLVTAINRFLINLLSTRLVDANAKVRDLML